MTIQATANAADLRGREIRWGEPRGQVADPAVSILPIAERLCASLLYLGITSMAGLAIVGLPWLHRYWGAGTGLVVYAAQRDEGESVHITAVEDRQSDLAAYLVTYLIPFVTAPLTSTQDVAAIAVFLLLLLALYFTSDLIAVNPLLALFGLRLYRITFEHSRNVWLLAGRPQAGSNMTVTRLIGSDIYAEVGT